MAFKCFKISVNVFLHLVIFRLITGLPVQKVYTSLGASSMQILLLSAHACMHFAWELQLDTQCLNLVYVLVANCNQNAYRHEQPTKESGVRIVAEAPKLGYAFRTCKPVS